MLLHTSLLVLDALGGPRHGPVLQAWYGKVRGGAGYLLLTGSRGVAERGRRQAHLRAAGSGGLGERPGQGCQGPGAQPAARADGRRAGIFPNQRVPERVRGAQAQAFCVAPAKELMGHGVGGRALVKVAALQADATITGGFACGGLAGH